MLYLSDRDTFPEEHAKDFLDKNPNFSQLGAVDQQKLLSKLKYRINRQQNTAIQNISKVKKDTKALKEITSQTAEKLQAPARARSVGNKQALVQAADGGSGILESALRERLTRQGAGPTMSLQARQLQHLANTMRDSIAHEPIGGSDDPSSDVVTGGTPESPKIKKIREHLDKFDDAIAVHNQWHWAAETPPELTRSKAAPEGGESVSTPLPRARAMDSASYRQKLRPTAKQILEIASEHLQNAARAFASKFPEHRLSADPATTSHLIQDISNSYALEHHGNMVERSVANSKQFSPIDADTISQDKLLRGMRRTGNTAPKYLDDFQQNKKFRRWAEVQLMPQAERDSLQNKILREKEPELRQEDLSTDSQIDLMENHPKFDSYPKTNEEAKTLGAPHSQQSVLLHYRKEDAKARNMYAGVAKQMESAKASGSEQDLTVAKVHDALVKTGALSRFDESTRDKIAAEAANRRRDYRDSVLSGIAPPAAAKPKPAPEPTPEVEPTPEQKRIKEAQRSGAANARRKQLIKSSSEYLTAAVSGTELPKKHLDVVSSVPGLREALYQKLQTPKYQKAVERQRKRQAEFLDASGQGE